MAILLEWLDEREIGTQEVHCSGSWLFAHVWLRSHKGLEPPFPVPRTR